MTLYCKNLYKIHIVKGRNGGITILEKKKLPLDLFKIYAMSIFKSKGGFQGRKKIEWEEFKKTYKKKIFKPVEAEAQNFFLNLNVKLDNIITFSKVTFGGGWYNKKYKPYDLISFLFIKTLRSNHKKTTKKANVHFLTPVKSSVELKISILTKKELDKYRKRISRIEKTNLNELKKLIRIKKLISEIFYLDKKINSKRVKTLRKDINQILYRAMTIANQKQMKKEFKLYQKIWRICNETNTEQNSRTGAKTSNF